MWQFELLNSIALNLAFTQTTKCHGIFCVHSRSLFDAQCVRTSSSSSEGSMVEWLKPFSFVWQSSRSFWLIRRERYRMAKLGGFWDECISLITLIMCSRYSGAGFVKRADYSRGYCEDYSQTNGWIKGDGCADGGRELTYQREEVFRSCFAKLKNTMIVEKWGEWIVPKRWALEVKRVFRKVEHLFVNRMAVDK